MTVSLIGMEAPGEEGTVLVVLTVTIYDAFSVPELYGRKQTLDR